MKKLVQLFSCILPSKIRRWVLNSMGHSISLKSRLGWLSIIMADKILMEGNARVDHFSMITGLSLLHMEANSVLSRFSYVSGTGKILLKERSFVGSRSILNTTSGDIEIGCYSALGPRSTIYTHGTFLPVTWGFGSKNMGVKIGDFSWVMHNCSLGPGVRIGSNSIVLPGSVMVKEVPDNVVIYDTPVERKSFPIELFKKTIPVDDLEKMIRDITITFLNKLLKKGEISSFEENTDYVNIFSGNKILRIHFMAPSSFTSDEVNENYDSCFFWHSIINDDLIKTDSYTLDFKSINKADSDPPLVLKSVESFLFYEYGLKFRPVN